MNGNYALRLIGRDLFPHSLTSDFAWFLSYASKLSVDILDIAVVANNITAAVITVVTINLGFLFLISL
jgi:hypothetical protein